MYKLNLQVVKESFAHRNPEQELVYLRIAWAITLLKKEKNQIEAVYKIALELAQKTDNDVVNQLSEQDVKQQQVKVFCMCGGGFLGRFAAEQPNNFYIDDRVGRLQYAKTSIYKEVLKLNRMAKEGIGRMPDFHYCGVF